MHRCGCWTVTTAYQRRLPLVGCCETRQWRYLNVAAALHMRHCPEVCGQMTVWVTCDRLRWSRMSHRANEVAARTMSAQIPPVAVARRSTVPTSKSENRPAKDG